MKPKIEVNSTETKPSYWVCNYLQWCLTIYNNLSIYEREPHHYSGIVERVCGSVWNTISTDNCY